MEAGVLLDDESVELEDFVDDLVGLIILLNHIVANGQDFGHDRGEFVYLELPVIEEVFQVLYAAHFEINVSILNIDDPVDKRLRRSHIIPHLLKIRYFCQQLQSSSLHDQICCFSGQILLDDLYEGLDFDVTLVG